MALLTFVGSFQKTGTIQDPLDQSVTGVGFKPKALIIYTSQDTSLDSLVDNFAAAVGFSDGVNDRCCWTGSDHGETTSDTYRFSSALHIIEYHDATNGTHNADAFVKSFDSDGFTLTWDSNNTATPYYFFIAYGGSDITDVTVGSFNQPTSTGAQSIDASVDNPNVLFTMSTGGTVEDSLSSNACKLTMGIATATDEEAAWSIGSDDDEATSNTRRRLETDASVLIVDEKTGTIQAEANLTGFDSDGFNLNWSTADSNARDIYYMVIKGGQWESGMFTQPATDINSVTTTSFEPEGLFLTSIGSPTTGSDITHNVFHVGITDGTNLTHAHASDEDNSSTTDAHKKSTLTYVMDFKSVNEADQGRATIDSFNPTDFTLAWTQTDTNERDVIYLVCASNPTGGTVINQSLMI